MLYSTLPFAIPALSVYKFLSSMNPASYTNYQNYPNSPYTSEVLHTITQIMMAESQNPKSDHGERILDMQSELQGPSSLSNLIQKRFSVVENSNEFAPIHSTGTDQDFTPLVGQYYISIDSGHIAKNDAEKALPWITAHELNHILNEDTILLQTVEIAVTLSTIWMSYYCGLSTVMTTALTFCTKIINHIAISQYIENAADDFANKHTNNDEKEEAIKYLSNIDKTKNEPSDWNHYLGGKIVQCLHPSTSARIQGIKDSMQKAKRQTQV